VWCVVRSVVCCGECVVGSVVCCGGWCVVGSACVVRSVVGCEECGGLWRVCCVVGSAVHCEECGGLWKVWLVRLLCVLRVVAAPNSQQHWQP